MKKIILYKGSKLHKIPTGLFTLVDDEDYEYLNQWKWGIDKRKYTNYAVRKGKSIQMHQVIMNTKKGEFVDHKNGFGLDNRKINLRKATRSQNQMNKRSFGTSRYLGVNLHKTKHFSKRKGHYIIDNTSKPWRAAIKTNTKLIYLGIFKTEEEAALAYNEAAKKYHGEFARLNDI